MKKTYDWIREQMLAGSSERKNNDRFNR